MIQKFLTEAREYCATRGIKLATLGRYAVNDSKLFSRLEGEGECLPRTMARVRAYMAENPVHTSGHGPALGIHQEDVSKSIKIVGEDK